MALALKPGTEWRTVYGRARAVAPEAFGDNRLPNYWGGRWRWEGVPEVATSPIDGSVITGPLRLDVDSAQRAVRDGFHEHRTWSVAPLTERKARVSAAVDDLSEHRDLLALLLVWEIGKTWASACAEVDRCIDGVRWYIGEVDGMLDGRTPLRGPVGNIAGWSHPMSVLMHAMLVQALAGTAAIAKVPADGGVNCLTLATALAGRHGLPFTLLSGSDSELSSVLANSKVIGKQHVLERKGLSCLGISESSDRGSLPGRIRKSFEDGKAHSRYVVRRSMFDEFLAAYLPVVRGLTFGHPLAVESPEDPLPVLGFGSLINDRKVKELQDAVDDAVGGGVPLHRGQLADGKFVPGQDTSAYFAPVSILEPPASSPLYHTEPGGPVDSIVLVDTEAELLAEMNVGNSVLAPSLIHAVTYGPA
jgi:acyl-CoA reductase-like NAD-dependent aldehyde dehydrogenase